MAVSGPTFETKVRRARADINDALGMAPQVPQPMTLPPMGLPPQGMMRQPMAVQPQAVPLQGAYPAGRLPLGTPSKAVSPLGMPPQNGALHTASIQQAQQQTAAPRQFMVGGYVEAPDPGPMALSNMSVQQLRRYYGGETGTDDAPLRFAKGGGAWTRKEGKNPEGGLNAKGRASLKAQGHDIKPPVSAKLAAKSPKAAARRKSFCARMSGMPGPMKDDKGRPTRKALSLRKWDC